MCTMPARMAPRRMVGPPMRSRLPAAAPATGLCAASGLRASAWATAARLSAASRASASGLHASAASAVGSATS